LREPALILACGALAAELRAVLPPGSAEVRYLPAHFHNRPERIVPALAPILDEARARGRTAFVAYADCGTGGALDRLLADHPGVERLPGAHCYELFAGAELFAALHDDEPGTFFLTDFLTRHFEPLVWQGLGLDRHPELRDVYFAHYQRVVLLSQADDPELVEAARRAADRLGLRFEQRHVGRRRLVAAISVAVDLPSRVA